MISIIIATYNSERFLARALDSVLSQVAVDYECIIVDGQSTDGTVAIIESYANKHKTIRFISESDKGIFDAYNKGWKMANGKWIYYLGSDDELLPDGLSRLAQSTEGFDAVYGNVIDRSEKGLRHWRAKAPEQLRFRMPCCHQAVLMKRDVIESLGGFNLDYKLSADFDLLQRAYLKGCKINQVDDEVCYFSVEGESNKNQKKTEREVIRITRNNAGLFWGHYACMFFMIRRIVKLIISMSRDKR